jgi:hypothetical protein
VALRLPRQPGRSAAFAATTEEHVFAWFCQDIENVVAQRSRQMLVPRA